MIKKFFKNDDGSSTVEYAVLAALAAAVLITALTNFFDAAGSKLTAGGEQLRNSNLTPEK